MKRVIRQPVKQLPVRPRLCEGYWPGFPTVAAYIAWLAAFHGPNYGAYIASHGASS